MKLSQFLGLVQAIGGEVLNFVPGAKIAQWAILAASAGQKIADAVEQHGIDVTDEEGEPLPTDVLVAEIQDALDRVGMTLSGIEQTGKDEINRSRAERGLPPLDES